MSRAFSTQPAGPHYPAAVWQKKPRKSNCYGIKGGGRGGRKSLAACGAPALIMLLPDNDACLKSLKTLTAGRLQPSGSFPPDGLSAALPLEHAHTAALVTKNSRAGISMALASPPLNAESILLKSQTVINYTEVCFFLMNFSKFLPENAAQLTYAQS